MKKDQSDRFQRLAAAFDAVVDLPPEERDDAIGRRCEGDAELERELRSLLAADEHGGFDDDLISGAVQDEARFLDTPDVRGTTLGSWRLLSTIGEGGMGTVYLAERADGAYDAQAAIKLVRGGLPSPAMSERFRSERQILAGLSHPGIARLLDGGSTADGTPYLVLEYVDGVPLTDWCDARDLGVEERLRLFLAMCDAVVYAHANLVAHRDLKPGNVLVGKDGAPKLLDFGIATLMDTVVEDSERVTRTRGVLTPAYASPEQILGRRAGVGADVYSLGVMLYELLTGRLPIDTRDLTPAQLASKVTEEVPPVASSVASDVERRKRLTGDLDAIVSRALRKEPEARYGSVAALAEDVRLHLQGMPVTVRRDDWMYRTRKLLGRNRGVVSSTLLVLVLGVAFTVNAVLQARAVAAERDRAEAEAATAERVSTFLEELFSEADPNQASSADVTVREILDRGSSRVTTALEAEPMVQSQIALVMGRVYRALGEYGPAEALIDSALAVRTRLDGTAPVDLADALVERGGLAYELGDYEGAVEMAGTALDAYRAELGGRDDPRIASALEWMSVSLAELGRLEEAEAPMRQAVEMYRRLDPEPNEALASALASFTDLLRTRGSYAEAFEVGAEALAMAREVFGPEHLEVASALNQHASTLSRWGRPEQAIPYVEEGLAIRRAVFDGSHVEVAASLGNLANILVGLERLDEALEPRRASTDMMRDIFPDGHPYVAAGTHSLGALLSQMGRVEEAEQMLREALGHHRAAFPAEHPNLAYPLTELGRLYQGVGRLEEARTVLEEAYAARSGGLPVGHWHIAASGLELGLTLDALGRPEEAERLLTEAYEILRETFDPTDERVVRARDALAAHFTARGMPERAAGLEG